MDQFTGRSPHHYPKPIMRPPAGITKWPKERYTPHVEHVKNMFPVDTMVTYETVPIRESTAPVCYRVVAINELWYDVEYDHCLYQPKSIRLHNVSFPSNGDFNVAPSRMRLLTTKEIALVDLQNKPPQGTA